MGHLVDYLGQVLSKKLGFVDAYNVSLQIITSLEQAFVELLNDELSFSLHLVVSYDIAIAALVSLVTRMFYQKNFLASNLLSLEASKELGALAGEHWSHNNLDMSTNCDATTKFNPAFTKLLSHVALCRQLLFLFCYLCLHLCISLGEFIS